MSDVPAAISENYEILRAIDASGPASEHVARHKASDTLVRLRIFDFGQTSSPTTRRHLREHLRCDITFMEELECPGVIRIFDYSDTKNLFWVATQPAEVDRLSKRFDFLASEPFQSRQRLVRQFLTILQQIHNSGVVHRNLSGDAVFLSSEMETYIGDFGFAGYLSDQPTTSQDTSLVVTTAYLPPEVKNAQTFSCNVSCDIFSAGLLAFEMLSATALPKDELGEIQEVLRARLHEQIAMDIISATAAEAILRAANPSPEKRWSTAEDFVNALEKPLQEGSFYSSISAGSTPTIGTTKPVEPTETMPVQAAPDAVQKPSQPAKAATELHDGITPLDPSHEIWNNHYEIIEKIGEGGQAVVYKAYDHLTNEEVAIKTMWSRHRGDRAAINRLKQGAMIARSLTHRYIIKTYSVEQRIDADGPGRYVFIVMELIKSQLELSDIIESRRASGQKIRLDETLHIIRQLLDSLAYAHEHTIHRDIKPGNIMLVPREEQAEAESCDLTKVDIKLIDFGIAKVLSQKHIDVTGQGFRSAHYGAPELADSKTGVDARADIFSAGVIMYQMLTKNIPRKGSPPANKVNKDVPAALAKVIDRAINADREKRFKTISEFTREIDRAVSRFNWLRKAAKIAAVLLIVIGITAAVKYFIPEPDELPLQQSIELLKGRKPDKEITTLANATVVRYADIAGYAPYDSLREATVEDLQTVARFTTDDKFKRNEPSWKKQEEVWSEIEPAVEKIESIAQNQREYNARRDLPVAAQLLKLEPSSEIVSEAKDKAQQAQNRLEVRPLKQDDLDFCAEVYDVGAKVYTNIETLSSGSDSPDSPDTAEQINNKLKNVEKLRNNFLPTHNSLETITQLKDSNFHERSSECFKKADRHYRSFALEDAEKYFTLLNQICGTMTYVRDQVDFSRSDIGLVSSRLMDLCYEDIETFENYPAWTEKLQQVYGKKDILAKYTLIQTMLLKSPEDVPLTVYDRTVSAKEQYEQGNVNSARAQLTDAVEEYKKFMRRKIDDLKRDCSSLSAFPSVSVEGMENCKIGLEKLSNSVDAPGWLRMDFADEYNRCAETITNEKNAIRQQLIQQARALKKKISSSGNKAWQQRFFWKSQLINEYVAVAQRYDTDNIDTSITNWKYVENLARLSIIVNQMKSVDSNLDRMLIRKDQLDQLAKNIDKAITFCEEFKGISEEERKKYKQWGSDLKELRAKLTTKYGNTYLIDQNDEVFTTEYTNVKSAFSEIRAKLPYHRSRVIELINKTHSLEKNTDYLNRCRQLWSDVLDQLNIPTTGADFDKTRTYLESVKETVDEWPSDRFNEQMGDSCKMVTDVFNRQSQAAAVIISAIFTEKSRLIESIESFEKKVGEILSDEDIRMLNEIAATGTQDALLRFRQLPELLSTSKQKLSNVILGNTAISESVISEDWSSGFEVDRWMVNFNTAQHRLDAHISQLQIIEDTVSIFQQTQQLLAQQSSVEADYYRGLRDYTVSVIDYSDLGNRIDSVEADNVTVKMCRFLEQMKNDTVPRLADLRASVTAISKELATLKSLEVDTLSEAKNFNKKRKRLLSQITTLQQGVAKLNRPNLENSCKQSVAHGVDEIVNLIGASGQAERLSSLTSVLWSFFPDHKDWSQWGSFLGIYHIAASDKDVWLNFFDLLRPVSEKGGYLSLSEIAANPTKVFYTDTGSSVNFGWPRYVSHQKDPSIILAFIHGSLSTNVEPFYMAVREITNAQYKLFMEKTAVKPTTNLAGWSYFGDQNGNLLIGQAQGQFPPCRITCDESTNVFLIGEKFKLDPVTWVTFDGGQAYAQWLGVQLPTASQHAYATRAGAGTMYPWGNQLSNIVSYAHVRSTAWQNAAREYNSKRDNPVEIAYPPVGAIKDFLRGKALDPARIVYAGNNNHPVWPCFTRNSQPNAWGLYDMLGNVWEWCTDMKNNATSVICGGSCLCPPEYINPDSKHELKTQACDIGFRIVIPAK